MSNETQRYKDNRSFILQTILPREYNTRPCPLQHPVAVSKNVTIDQKTFIKPQVFPPTNSTKVRMDQGMYLWYVKNGVESLYHMGIIPLKAFAHRTTNLLGVTPQVNVNSAANNGQNGVPGLPLGVNTGLDFFLFNSALAVPRLDDAPTFSPNLAEKFSRTRVYGGDLRLISNTVAAGSTVLNGLLSSAVISDTRDIAQNASGDDCFAVVDMAQASRTPKEIVRDVSAASGIISLVGADIDATYRAPDSLNDIRVSDGWFSAPGTNAINFNILVFTGSTPDVARVQYSIFSSWASPWNVQQGEGFNGVGSLNYPGQQGIVDPSGSVAIQIPTLAETGIVDVNFNIQAQIAGGSTGDYNNALLTFTLTSVVEHYFCGIGDSVSGTLSFSKLSTSKTVTCSYSELRAVNLVAGSQLLTNQGVSFGHDSDISDQYIAAGGMKKIGKFIGVKTYASVTTNYSGSITDCNMPFIFTSSCPPVVTSGTLGPMNLWQTTTAGAVLGGPRTAYRAREINIEGECGPVHILRYDDIGADQNLVLNGMLNTESVATSGIAPYVRESIANSKMSSDANVYPVVYTLYNCLSRFKETWDLQDYLASRDYFRNLTPEEFAAIGEEDPRVENSMQAAGLFGSLGSILGGAAGSLLGNSGVGSAIGGALGGIGDNMFHTAGQFGDMRARGRFTSAGQFDAKGQFLSGGGFEDGSQQDFGAGQNGFTDKTSCRRQRQY